MVVNALVQAIPSIGNVLLVCLVFWLVFGIMGVTLFSGRFYSCEDSEQKLVNASLVPDKQTCLEMAHLNYSWVNPTINFDSVPAAYLALFQVVNIRLTYPETISGIYVVMCGIVRLYFLCTCMSTETTSAKFYA